MCRCLYRKKRTEINKADNVSSLIDCTYDTIQIDKNLKIKASFIECKALTAFNENFT